MSSAWQPGRALLSHAAHDAQQVPHPGISTPPDTNRPLVTCRRVAEQVYEKAVAHWQGISDVIKANNLDSHLGGEPPCMGQCMRGS